MYLMIWFIIFNCPAKNSCKSLNTDFRSIRRRRGTTPTQLWVKYRISIQKSKNSEEMAISIFSWNKLTTPETGDNLKEINKYLSVFKNNRIDIDLNYNPF